MKGENKVVFTEARTQSLPSLVKEMSGLQITQEKQIYCVIFHKTFSFWGLIFFLISLVPNEFIERKRGRRITNNKISSCGFNHKINYRATAANSKENSYQALYSYQAEIFHVLHT